MRRQPRRRPRRDSVSGSTNEESPNSLAGGDQASGLQHPPGLGQHSLGVGRMVEQCVAVHHVE